MPFDPSQGYRLYMRDRPPDHPPFFKFTSAEVCLAILNNRTLRWSTPGTLNDPYDTQFDLYMPSPTDELVETALRKNYETVFEWGPIDATNPLGRVFYPLRPLIRTMPREEFVTLMRETTRSMLLRDDLLRELHATMRELAKNTKILCLTTDPTSVAMWSHYAAQHTGAVLRFRTAPFTDSPWPQARPVAYSETLPLLFTDDEWSDFAAGRGHLDPAVVFDRLILTKAQEWSYEREWRLTSGNGRDPAAPFEYIEFGELELAEVILGVRMTAADKDAIRGIVGDKYPHAQVSQAEKAPRDYRIVRTPV